jgi:3-methyladenine DNA glycosylase AlkD
MTERYPQIDHALMSLENPSKTAGLKRFFKTGPGQYSEGDIFLGITVPQLRTLSKIYADLTHEELQLLLLSPHHEKRLFALIVMVNQYKKASKADQEKLHRFYLTHRAGVNNWDLVDSSAAQLVGAYLWGKPKDLLITFAHSPNLWERRIAMIATYYDIKLGDFTYPLQIATILVHDSHDLIQKAVGWMLREIGKRDLAVEETFLNQHAATMPRAMLRYAIEKFPQEKRLAYLNA